MKAPEAGMKRKPQMLLGAEAGQISPATHLIVIFKKKKKWPYNNLKEMIRDTFPKSLQ